MFRTVPLSNIRSFSLYTYQNLYDIYHCCVYSEKLLMMEDELSETCRILFQ